MSADHQAPEGFEVRSVAVADAPAIAELINEVTLVEVGVPWTTVEETRDHLTSPGRDRAPEEAVLVEADGALAGYVQFWGPSDPVTEMQMLVFVSPRVWGRGLSAWLLRLGEERVREMARPGRADERVVLRVSRFAGNEPAGRLFASLGYRYARTFWVMRIELEEGPPAPRVPSGIRIRTFEPGRDEVGVHAALAEAFADHWGAPFPSLEEWMHQDVEGEGAEFDPDLWFLAVEGEETVGVAGCRARTPRSAETAEVAILGVRRAWRRRGIGLALLLTAFAEIRRRDIREVELGVDADSPTGATLLYERAGMRPAEGWEVWEKALE